MDSGWGEHSFDHHQDGSGLNSLVSPSGGARTTEWHERSFPVVVIGGSAGGLAALGVLANQLPRGFPASILVALHWPPRTRGAHQFLGGRLPVAFAADGAPLRPGGITLAPPDWHLLVDDGALRLSQSREEHHFRPAIDPLFRTAARAYGPRVVGVLLSGGNADGTAGLLNVVLHGGLAIVQDPDEAEYAAMPRSALDNVPGARCLRLTDIAAALVQVTAATRRPDERRGRPDLDHWAAARQSGPPEQVRIPEHAHPSTSRPSRSPTLTSTWVT
jgi:two-component system chemotaxis response regulator CheB